MLTLRDGPAKGTYMVKRAPIWLRAVVDADGKADVLDQLTDTPSASESVYVYQIVGEVGHVHLSMANRKQSGFYVVASYEYLPDVDGETLRQNAEWRAWCAIESNTLRAPGDLT